VSYDAIPTGLRRLRQWVVWKYVQREGASKPTKEPRRAMDTKWLASSTDPESWSSFEEAVAA
jgi:primase-polymerase (primpol)-like protein